MYSDSRGLLIFKDSQTHGLSLRVSATLTNSHYGTWRLLDPSNLLFYLAWGDINSLVLLDSWTYGLMISWSHVLNNSDSLWHPELIRLIDIIWYKDIKLRSWKLKITKITSKWQFLTKIPNSRGSTSHYPK